MFYNKSTDLTPFLKNEIISDKELPNGNRLITCRIFDADGTPKEFTIEVLATNEAIRWTLTNGHVTIIVINKIDELPKVVDPNYYKSK